MFETNQLFDLIFRGRKASPHLACLARGRTPHWAPWDHLSPSCSERLGGRFRGENRVIMRICCGWDMSFIISCGCGPKCRVYRKNPWNCGVTQAFWQMTKPPISSKHTWKLKPPTYPQWWLWSWNEPTFWGPCPSWISSDHKGLIHDNS